MWVLTWKHPLNPEVFSLTFLYVLQITLNSKRDCLQCLAHNWPFLMLANVKDNKQRPVLYLYVTKVCSDPIVELSVLMTPAWLHSLENVRKQWLSALPEEIGICATKMKHIIAGVNQKKLNCLLHCQQIWRAKDHRWTLSKWIPALLSV